MSKLFNWTFGSFFRSIGRVLAYVFIGLLLSLLINKLGINFNDLLGFDVIHAEEENVVYMYSIVNSSRTQVATMPSDYIDIVNFNYFNNNIYLLDTTYNSRTRNFYVIVFKSLTNNEVIALPLLFTSTHVNTIGDSKSLNITWTDRISIYNDSNTLVRTDTSLSILYLGDTQKSGSTTYYGMKTFSNQRLLNSDKYVYSFSYADKTTFLSSLFNRELFCVDSILTGRNSNIVLNSDMKFYFNNTFDNYCVPPSEDNTPSIPHVDVSTDEYYLFYTFSDIQDMSVFESYDFTNFTDFEKLVVVFLVNILYILFIFVIIYILLKALNKIVSWLFR